MHGESAPAHVPAEEEVGVECGLLEEGERGVRRVREKRGDYVEGLRYVAHSCEGGEGRG